MKYLALNFSVFCLFAFYFSCSENDHQTNENPVKEVETIASKKINVNLKKSKIFWRGKVVGGVKDHKGHIPLKSGFVLVDGNKLKKFVVETDMLNIKATDDNYKNEGSRKHFLDHLAASDFFDTKRFKVAKFSSTKMTKNNCDGNMTIRDKTFKEKLTNYSFTKDKNGQYWIKGKMVFGRKKYGVSYQSTIKNHLVSDDVELSFEIAVNL